MNNEYFTEKELACKCCGFYNFSGNFKEILNNAREISAIGYIINCGCRCIKHNKEVGGEEDSSHIATETKECTAVDIKVEDPRIRFKIMLGLVSAGVHRIGIGNTFIHADNDLSKDKQVAWLYL